VVTDRSQANLESGSDPSLDRLWDAQAQAWTRWVRDPVGDPWHRLFNWPAFASLLPEPGRLTIDLGCGEGRVGVELRRAGHRLIGVDAAATMVGYARETGVYDDVLLTSACRVPLPDAVADLVVAYMSLHDMDDVAGAVREAGRLLAPGGRLCAAVVHPFTSAQWTARYASEVRYAEPSSDPTRGIVFHGVHRPLEAYVRACATAGLTLERLAEPVPSAAAIRVHPSLQRATLRPAFLHLRASRG
jgi:SAM-dependent methyltransferase